MAFYRKLKKREVLKLASFVLLYVMFPTSCTFSKTDISQKITIAGRIINYEPDSEKSNIAVIINDNGLADQVRHAASIDDSGHFNIKFDRYYPQDVMLSYKTNFRVLVHPGDSLYIEFDGGTRSRTEIFKTIRFEGEHAQLNRDFALYLKHYFDSRPNSQQRRAYRRKTLSEFKGIQDSIKSSRMEHAATFILNQNPSEELITWIKCDIEYSYLDNLLSFPNSRKYGEYPENWEAEYYDFIECMPTISTKELINSDIRWLINQYHVNYVTASIFNFGGKIMNPNIDSFLYCNIIEIIPAAGLLKQLTLTEFLNHNLSKYKIETFESNLASIEEIIVEPYLIDPLMSHYHDVKRFLEKPLDVNDVVALNSDNEDAQELWKNIVQQGKDKVLYVDCWGTWCGACLTEMPFSVKLHETFKGEQLKFIYLCFKSNKDQWKKLVQQHKLAGEHYFLTSPQDEFFINLFGISGYPTYVILDKQGRIVRKGSSFRPSNEETQVLLESLLQK